MHGDGDNAAKRQPANVGASDSKCIHRRQHRGREVVAACIGDKLAFAVTGIVERKRPTRLPEMLDLRPPDRFVGPDAMEEDGRHGGPAASLNAANGSFANRNCPHRFILAAWPTAR